QLAHRRTGPAGHRAEPGRVDGHRDRRTPRRRPVARAAGGGADTRGPRRPPGGPAARPRAADPPPAGGHPRPPPTAPPHPPRPRRAFGAIPRPRDENDPAYRAAVLPASNGIATADGLARFYASLIGEVDGGRRLFTTDTMELARGEQSAGPDRVLVVGTRFGLGYMLHGAASPLLSPDSFGHPGRGGGL